MFESKLLIKRIPISSEDQFEAVVADLKEELALDLHYSLRLLRYKPRGDHEILAFYETSDQTLATILAHHQATSTSFSEGEIWNILYYILRSLAELEQLNIGHGCVTLEDIYCLPDNSFKVVYPSIASAEPHVLTRNLYYSPELLAYFRHRKQYRSNWVIEPIDIFKSDVFSAGMCVMALCRLQSVAGVYNYEGCEIVKEDVGQLLASIQQDYSEMLVDFLASMLSFNAERRPSSGDLCQDLQCYLWDENEFTLGNIRESLEQLQVDQEDKEGNTVELVQSEWEKIDLPDWIEEVPIQNKSVSEEEQLKENKENARLNVFSRHVRDDEKREKSEKSENKENVDMNVVCQKGSVTESQLFTSPALLEMLKWEVAEIKRRHEAG